MNYGGQGENTIPSSPRGERCTVVQLSLPREQWSKLGTLVFPSVRPITATITQEEEARGERRRHIKKT